MKLNPQRTTETPTYPRRNRSTIGSVKKAAIAIGTSALLGLSACSGADANLDPSPNAHQAQPDATQSIVVGDPQTVNPVEVEVTPINQEEMIQLAGEAMPTSLPPEPVQPQPPTPPRPQQDEIQLPPVNQDETPHIRGGIRPPILRTPDQQPTPPQPGASNKPRSPQRDPRAQNPRNPQPPRVDPNNPQLPPVEIVPVRTAGLRMAPTLADAD